MSVYLWLPLTLAFLAGVGWRLFARASKAYRSKLRSYPSRWAFVAANWDVFLLRTVFSGGFFALWLFHPSLLSQALILMHVPASLANWLGVTPTLGSAVPFGFMSDYALDQIQIRLNSVSLPTWVPAALAEALKGEIPSYDANVVNGDTFVQNNNRDAGFVNKPTGDSNQ